MAGMLRHAKASNSGRAIVEKVRKRLPLGLLMIH